MNPQHPQRNAAVRIFPRSQKSFALLAALFLSLFVFVFSAGEAGAEEQTVLPMAQRCATPTGTAPPSTPPGAPPGTAICPPTVLPSAIDTPPTPPVDALPVGTTAHGMPSAGPFPPPPGSVPAPGFEQGPGQHPLPSPGAPSSGPEPTRAPQESLSKADSGPSDRHGPTTPPTHLPDTKIAPEEALPTPRSVPRSGADPGPPATEGSVAPSSANEPKPAPYALRKDGPAGSRPYSAPDKVPASTSPPIGANGKQAPSVADRATDQRPSWVAVPGAAHSTVRQVVEPLVQQDLPSFAAASRSAVDEALTQTHKTFSETVASALGTLESWTAGWLPSGEAAAQSASEGAAPDPLVPLVPPMSPLGDSSFFSLPGTMQVGSGGGLGLLLLGVLASGLLLLRRDGPLSWISYELPRPTSALLLPLERPG